VSTVRRRRAPAIRPRPRLARPRRAHHPHRRRHHHHPAPPPRTPHPLPDPPPLPHPLTPPLPHPPLRLHPSTLCVSLKTNFAAPPSPSPPPLPMCLAIHPLQDMSPTRQRLARWTGGPPQETGSRLHLPARQARRGTPGRAYARENAPASHRTTTTDFGTRRRFLGTRKAGRWCFLSSMRRL